MGPGGCGLNSVALTWILAVFLVTVSLKLLSTFTDSALTAGNVAWRDLNSVCSLVK